MFLWFVFFLFLFTVSDTQYPLRPGAYAAKGRASVISGSLFRLGLGLGLGLGTRNSELGNHELELERTRSGVY